MSFVDAIKEKAKNSIKTIVLPESTDLRVLEAARKVTDEGFAKVVLVGDRKELENIAGNIDISDIKVINNNFKYMLIIFKILDMFHTPRLSYLTSRTYQ